MTEHKAERPLILVPGLLESNLTFKENTIWPLTSSQVSDYDSLINLLSDLGTNIPESIDDDPLVEPKDLYQEYLTIS